MLASHRGSLCETLTNGRYRGADALGSSKVDRIMTPSEESRRRLNHFGVYPRVPVLRYVPTTGAATCQCAYQKRCSHSVHFASKQIQAVSCTNNLSLFSYFGTADASASPGRPLGGRFSRPAAQSRWPSLKSATRAPSQTLRSGQVRSGQARPVYH